jgi:hypothetical protein
VASGYEKLLDVDEVFFRPRVSLSGAQRKADASTVEARLVFAATAPACESSMLVGALKLRSTTCPKVLSK